MESIKSVVISVMTDNELNNIVSIKEINIHVENVEAVRFVNITISAHYARNVEAVKYAYIIANVARANSAMVCQSANMDANVTNAIYAI